MRRGRGGPSRRRLDRHFHLDSRSLGVVRRLDCVAVAKAPPAGIQTSYPTSPVYPVREMSHNSKSSAAAVALGLAKIPLVVPTGLAQIALIITARLANVPVILTVASIPVSAPVVAIIAPLVNNLSGVDGPARATHRHVHNPWPANDDPRADIRGHHADVHLHLRARRRSERHEHQSPNHPSDMALHLVLLRIDPDRSGAGVCIANASSENRVHSVSWAGTRPPCWRQCPLLRTLVTPAGERNRG